MACNAPLKATSKKAMLASPGYPLTYKDVTTDCYWDITADQPDGRVAIIFEEFQVCTPCHTMKDNTMQNNTI